MAWWEAFGVCGVLGGQMVGGGENGRSLMHGAAVAGRAVIAPELELAGWRRSVAELYARVRAEDDPEHGHALWRAGRDELFRDHPQSPLRSDDPLRTTGLPYWPYDPAARFELPLLAASEDRA